MNPSSLFHELERVAIIIGINHNGPEGDYGHGIPNLSCAARDAGAVASSLKQHHGYRECILLQNEQASKQQILAQLTSLSNRMTEQHQVLFYFAGHGMAKEDGEGGLQGFLIPSGATRGSSETYIAMSHLRDIFNGMRCRHLLVVLDCCYAGTFGKPAKRELKFGTTSPYPTPEPLFARWMKRRSYSIFVSASHDERALDSLEGPNYLVTRVRADQRPSALSHSPFAQAFLEGIRPGGPADYNHDGILTLHELFLHISGTFAQSEQAPIRHAPLSIEQTPQLRPMDWDDGGQFVFLVGEPKLIRAEDLTTKHNPYRGLEPFEENQKHLFFGRERIVHSLFEHMNARCVTTVVGPSGAGKSSLIQAGILPHLKLQKLQWSIFGPLRLGGEPITALGGGVLSMPEDNGDRSLTGPVLIVIDQMEELLTIGRQSPEQSAFLKMLALFLKDAPSNMEVGRVLAECSQFPHAKFAERVVQKLLQHRDRLKILLTLRDDYEDQLIRVLAQPPEEANAIKTAWSESRYVIPAMNREELRECIEKPAQEKFVFFDMTTAPGGKRLVDTLLDDVENMPGRLPLLSVALSEMFLNFLRRASLERTILWKDYHAVGGVTQALQKKAEAVYADPYSDKEKNDPPEDSETNARRKTLMRILLRMVTLEGGELSRRRVCREELESVDPNEQRRVECVLNVLESNRLVVGVNPKNTASFQEERPVGAGSNKVSKSRPPELARNSNEQRHIEPAHDRLVRGWPRLSEEITASQTKLILQRNLWEAARQWETNKNDSHLWHDARILRLNELKEAADIHAQDTHTKTRAPSTLSRVLHRSYVPLHSFAEVMSLETLLNAIPPHTFNKTETAFVRESFRVRRRRLIRLVGAISMVFGALASLLLVAWSQYDLAKRQSEKANEAKQNLEKTLNATKGAAAEVVRTVGDLRNIAGGATARKNLLSSIEKLQKSLIENQRQTPESLESARALRFEFGKLAITHGHFKEADKEYAQGCLHAEELAQTNPPHIKYEHYRALCYRERSIIAAELKDFESASKYLRKAQDLTRTALKANPRLGFLILDEGANLNHEGRLRYKKFAADKKSSPSAKKEDFCSPLIRSIEALGVLSNEASSNTVIDWQERQAYILSEKERVLADNHLRLGIIEWEFGDLKSAAQSLETAISIGRNHLEKEPSNSDLRRNLSMAYHHLAFLEGQQGDKNPAKEHFVQALELALGLIEEDPANLVWQKDFVILCTSPMGHSMWTRPWIWRKCVNGVEDAMRRLREHEREDDLNKEPHVQALLRAARKPQEARGIHSGPRGLPP